MAAPRFVPSSLRKPHWFLLGREAAVKRTPQRHVVLGNPIVTFTGDTPDAELAVMDDACPHRGASLARGAVRGACIQCPGHGMAFGPRTSPARAYDYAVLQGLVWVDLGKDLLAQHAMPPCPPEFSSPDFRTAGYTLELGGGVNAVLLLEALLSSGGEAEGARVDTRYELPFTLMRRVEVRGQVVLALLVSLLPVSRRRLLAHVHLAVRADDDAAAYLAATELLVREHAALVRTIDPEEWSRNHLVPADGDALVARYRAEMTRVFPDLLAYFVVP